MAPQEKAPKQILREDILTLLGNNLIDVDLTTADLDMAIKVAVEKYRQRSSNAVTETGFFLTLSPNSTSYTLPKEVIEIESIQRRGLSADAGSSTAQQYDPFSLAYTNLYLLQPTGQGDLLTYDLYSQWLGTAGKLFGATYDFRWDSYQNKLTIIREQRVYEDVLLKAYLEVPEDSLITGRYSSTWLRNYSTAKAKEILGQAYEKFSAIPGATGSITLNGAQLKAEAVAEMNALEEQLKTYQSGERPIGIVIG